jgi:hypothetical protein
LFLFGVQQVKEQRAKTGFAEHAGNVLIARAVPAASATVRENHQTSGGTWNGQACAQGDAIQRD